MRLSTLVVTCFCFVGLTQLAWSQHHKADAHTKNVPTMGIPGYLDPVTGTFKPRVERTADSLAAAVRPTVSPTTGTFIVYFTTTIKSSIPANAVISCELNVDTSEVVGQTYNSFYETGTGFANRGSGSTVSCTATVPYSWLLTTPGSDTVRLSWTISVEEPGAIGSIPSVFTARTSMADIGSFPVPPNGSVNAETIYPTI